MGQRVVLLGDSSWQSRIQYQEYMIGWLIKGCLFPAKERKKERVLADCHFNKKSTVQDV